MMTFFYLLCTVIGYILGCFSTAYIVGRVFGNLDIHEHGSGNVGTTNIMRTLGIKAGIITFIGDAFKGVLAVWIGQWIGHEIGGYICGIAAVIGHTWPIFLKFKGGKGIATSLGTILALQPIIALIMLIVAIGLIALTRYVSLASVGGALAFPIISIITKWDNKPLIVFSLLLGFMAVYKHKENIKRLIQGKENKFGIKSNK
jgi:acyl phosphate:glycerol-3-phosphate acyltransferase